MIGYITIGTNDLEKAGAFYDEILNHFGGKRWMENERMVAWSAGEGTPGVGVIKPFDGNAATVGNGSMVSLAASDPEHVQAVHAKAMELGGQNEGEPGLRFGTFYGAYFRDLDGNKLCTFCIVPEESAEG